MTDTQRDNYEYDRTNPYPDIFEKGKRADGKPTIIIRRKPSEIPRSLDWALLKLAGTASQNGPESIVIYEFLIPERYPTALVELYSRGWKPNNPSFQDLRVLVEDFIRVAPSFPGDTDYAKRIGEVMAKLEDNQ
jgi:hypothetical protein